MLTMKFIYIAGFVSLILVSSVSPSVAQFAGGLKYVTLSSNSPVVQSGKGSTMVVTLRVKPGFHINSVKPNDPDLLATTLTVTPVKGLRFGRATFPLATVISSPALSAQPLSVYVGTVKFSVPVDSSKAGTYHVPISVFYQGCNETACFPPKTDSLDVTVLVK